MKNNEEDRNYPALVVVADEENDSEDPCRDSNKDLEGSSNDHLTAKKKNKKNKEEGSRS